MLPTKVMQLDYQDFATLVWDSIPSIVEYQKNKNIKFSCILGKLRNGSLAASILANELQITMGVYYAPRKELNLENEVFIPKETLLKLQNLQQNETVDILFVDSISGTGNTVVETKQMLKSLYGDKLVMHSYSVLCDTKASKVVDIAGLVSEKFFQPPWEWRSYTPSSHLDRLLTGNVKGSNEDSYALGYSSQRCKDNFLMNVGFPFNPQWEVVFELLDVQRQLQCSSGVSSLEVPESLSFEDARGKFSLLLNEKENFIKTNGLTHFIEDDCVQAILLSEKCPVTHILYFDGQELNKVYARNINKEKFINMM